MPYVERVPQSSAVRRRPLAFHERQAVGCGPCE